MSTERWQEIARELGFPSALTEKSKTVEAACKRIAELESDRKELSASEWMCASCREVWPLGVLRAGVRVVFCPRCKTATCGPKDSVLLRESDCRIAELEADRKELSDAVDVLRQGHESTQEMLRSTQERAAAAEIKVEELEAALAKEKARADGFPGSITGPGGQEIDLIHYLTKEERLKMKPPFPPEPGYEEERGDG